MVNAFRDACMKWGIRINIEKTQIVSIGAEEANILIAGCVLENVSEFCYLGNIVTKSEDYHTETVKCIQKASRTFFLGNVDFTNPGFSKNTNCESLDQ